MFRESEIEDCRHPDHERTDKGNKRGKADDEPEQQRRRQPDGSERSGAKEAVRQRGKKTAMNAGNDRLLNLIFQFLSPLHREGQIIQKPVQHFFAVNKEDEKY